MTEDNNQMSTRDKNRAIDKTKLIIVSFIASLVITYGLSYLSRIIIGSSLGPLDIPIVFIISFIVLYIVQSRFVS